MRNVILTLIGALLIAGSLVSLAMALSQSGVGYASAGSGAPMQGPEVASPADRVDSDQITMTSNGLLIRDLKNVRLVNLADTNSMDPVLDAEATAVEVVPQTTNELHVGDIVSYKSGSNTIIHRIISIGSDSGGWYAIVKGDNNAVADPNYVRFEQIQGVVVGIVY